MTDSRQKKRFQKAGAGVAWVRQRRIHLADIARVHERSGAVDIDLKSGQGVSIPLNGLRRDDIQELLSILRATQLD